MDWYLLLFLTTTTTTTIRTTRMIAATTATIITIQSKLLEGNRHGFTAVAQSELGNMFLPWQLAALMNLDSQWVPAQLFGARTEDVGAS
jgi:hypothetical protein